MAVGFQDGFQLNDLLNIGEPDDAHRLRILRLLDENTPGILQQDTFDKTKHTGFFESTDEKDVPSLKGVTRNTPLHFFGQPTVKNDPSQFLQFFLPLFGFSYISVNLGI